MKTVLVNPPPRRREYESIVVPPLGLMYVASSLAARGFDVSVKDAFAERMTWDGFGEWIAKERPDVLGIGGMSPVIDTVFKAVRIARPFVRHVVLGGPHASLYRAEVFRQCPEIDYAVAGEGEQTAVELIGALEAGKPLAGIPGVYGKDFSGAERAMAEDIDAIPFPDRGMIPNGRYAYPLLRHRRVTTMLTSRGCPYSCTFCDKSTFGSKWRPRSAANVLEEIDEVVNRFGIKSVVFYDDLFTVDRKRVAAICEGILQRGWKLDWKCEGRVNTADGEVLRLMKRAGCSIVAYGVESANRHGLDYLNKNTTPEQARRAFAMTREAGLKTVGYFILGIPVETYEDELRTADFACEIRPDYAQFSVLSPYYGTKIYEEAVAKGWYAEVEAGNPVDKDLKRPAILSPNWDEEKLARILRVAHRRFYFRFSYILGRLADFRGWVHLMANVRIFAGIIFWSFRKKKEGRGAS